ncbi:MAG: formate dehydrogenase accessory sulfurtransferase FdhD [Planctomycetota bacterium]
MVIPEAAVKIRLNHQIVAMIICRPDNPEEACIGFLLNHHTIKSMDEIKSIQVHPRAKIVSIQARLEKEKIDELVQNLSSGGHLTLIHPPVSRTTGDALCNLCAHPPEEENKTYRVLTRMANLFQETCEVKGIFGAYHVAAFVDASGKITCQGADVGMDITVDRVLGKAFLSHHPLQNCTLLISDRLRVNTVIKCANLGIRSIMTLSVVTHMALETALNYDIDIIHAKKDGSLTIYSRSTAESTEAEACE